MLATTEGDPERVRAVATSYRNFVELEDEEVARLRGAVRAFPIVIDCWLAATYPFMRDEIAAKLRAKDDQAASIAQLALQTLRATKGRE